MTEKTTYWLRDAVGDYALVTGATDRDRWVPLGWAEADEPTGGEFVWARCDGIEQPARFPADALNEVWATKGWKAAEPPSPISPFNGDQGAPVIPAAAPIVAAEPSETPAKSNDAAPKSNQRTAANPKE